MTDLAGFAIMAVSMLAIIAPVALAVRGTPAFIAERIGRALGLTRHGKHWDGQVGGCMVHLEVGKRAVVHVMDPRRLDLYIRPGHRISPCNTGDAAFDGAVWVDGSAVETAVAFNRRARELVGLEVATGWRHQPGAWTRALLDEDVVTGVAIVKGGVSLARSMAWNPGEALPRLLETARHDPVVSVRARALMVLGEVFPTDPDTVAILAAHADSDDTTLRAAAIAWTRDAHILERVVLGAHEPEVLRLIAFDQLAEVAPAIAARHLPNQEPLLVAGLRHRGEPRATTRALLRRVGGSRAIVLLERALAPDAPAQMQAELASDVATIRARLGGAAAHGRLALTDGAGAGALALTAVSSEVAPAAVDAARATGKVPA